jgi:putative aminopeptidase FrvX
VLRPDTVTLLQRLSEASGLAGHEGEVRAALREILQDVACEIYTDTIGNLICRKGNGPLRVMLDAHMDEVGLVVTGYHDSGLLRFKESGGLDPRVLPGRSVLVGPGKTPGVIGAQAVHLLGRKERDKVLPVKDLYVDIGARSRDEAASVTALGDPICFSTRFERLSDTVAKGKAFDNRVGCVVVARALLEDHYPELTVFGVFSVQEEVGLRGAQVAAYHLAPNLALAIDGTSSSNVPGVEPPATSTHMGEGPAISLLDGTIVMDHRIREQLTSLAGKHSIPYQYRRLTTAGTDAGGVFLQRTGIPACTMAVPCRYIHSPSSLVDLDDLDNTVRLTRLFLESLDKGEFTL